MGFHQRRVNFERFQSGSFSLGKGVSGLGGSVIAENVIGVDETYIWERIAGVFLDRALEVLDAFPHSFLGAFIRVESAAEVVLICLCVDRTPIAQTLFLLAGKAKAQVVRDFVCDL